MITSNMLVVYREFGGVEDYWVKAGCPKHDQIGNGDWLAIQNLVQELTMLKRNLVSREYGEQIRRKLADVAADEATAQTLLEMA